MHSKTISLDVVSVAFPIILGLDWLSRHNPSIDWANPSLVLSCCNLSSPFSIWPRGSGLVGLSLSSSTLHTCSVTSTGLGLSLRASSSCRVPVPEPVPKPEEPASTSPPPAPLFLSFLTKWTGFGRSSLEPALPSPSPKVSICNLNHFCKYSKNTPIGILNFHPVGSPSYISATSPSPPNLKDDISEPKDSPNSSPPSSFLPPKYMPWADSVVSPTAVNDLLPHYPYNCAIKIKEGKSSLFGPLYCLTQDEHKALGDYIKDNLQKGFIHRSTSPAASPILFVHKKTGDLCLCVDYRGLNAITKKNHYPLPHINDLLDHTQGCKFFTVIDLKNAFNLVCIRERDE
ncbi:hypothetical protein EST38_g10159 [Candolleomyces aberdarensis]|uniref:Reverse transcriptase domain-containing protein n=1 Tax=Candolleomyces aberdarensis TaxID=2316362 RepID=A0A4Q2D841_9AGAR|nr:hypothetical protein EST38_g10159 [Candolleomyces aberdarensis]